jgi:hypothetical protein
VPAWRRKGSARAIIIIFSGAGVAMQKTSTWTHFKQEIRIKQLKRAISVNLLVVSNGE